MTGKIKISPILALLFSGVYIYSPTNKLLYENNSPIDRAFLRVLYQNRHPASTKNNAKH
jgi:hypothetical protein